MRISLYYNNSLWPEKPELFTAEERRAVLDDILPRYSSQEPWRNTDQMQLIWAGQVKAVREDWPEEVFAKFNTVANVQLNVRSMDIGDVVVVEQDSGHLIGAWACAMMGWQNITPSWAERKS